MDSLLEFLDHSRSSILRWSLQFPFARALFKSRAQRLLFFFLISLIINLALSLSVPVWMLVIGPVVFGLPHLVSGARYIARSHGLNYRTGFLILISILAVGAIRLLQTFQYGNWILIPGWMDAWEWLAFLITLVWLFFQLKTSTRGMWWKIAVFALVAAVGFYFPVPVAAFLLIGHNFVSFFYWIQATQTRDEKNVAYWALGLFALVTASILLGTWDSILHWTQAGATELSASASGWSFGQLVFPGSQNDALLDRGLCAYAFGQALHYFVWLKAVPEQSIAQTVPLSFRVSARDFVRDLTRPVAVICAVICLIPLMALFLVHVDVLRNVYVAGSTAHGYIEFAGLSFFAVKRA